MRFIILTFFVGVTSIAKSNISGLDLKSYRQEVFELNKDSQKAWEFYAKLNTLDKPSATLLAYKGIAAAHIAKVSSNPFKKLSMLRKAKMYLEEAVVMDHKNIEIRFLRYAMQVQIPKILGMSTNIQEDKNYILTNYYAFDWSSLDKEVCRYIFNFMIEEGDCSYSEKLFLMEYFHTSF